MLWEVNIFNTLCASDMLEELAVFQAMILPPVLQNPALSSTRVAVLANALDVTKSNWFLNWLLWLRDSARSLTI